MTVGQLKRVLQNALDTIENYEDDTEIELDNNTYEVVNQKNSRYWLGITGYDGGYLVLDKDEYLIDACEQGIYDYAEDESDGGDYTCDCGGRIKWNKSGTKGICDKCGEEC